MGDGCHGDASRAGCEGWVDTNSARKGVLQEFASAEQAKPDGTLTASLKERS